MSPFFRPGCITLYVCLTLFLGHINASENVTDTTSSDSTMATTPSTITSSDSTMATTPSTTTTTRKPAEVSSVMDTIRLGIPDSSEVGTGSKEEECKEVEVEVEDCITTFLSSVESELVWYEGNYPAMVHKDTDISDYCSRVNVLKACLNGGEIRKCSSKNDRVQYLVDRVEGPAIYICTDAKLAFLHNSDCLAPAVLDRCSEKYDIIALTNKAALKGEACSKMHMFLECLVTDVASACPRMDGYVEVIQRQWLQALMSNIGCTVFVSGVCQRPLIEECVDPFLAQNSFYVKNKTSEQQTSRFLRGTYPAAVYSETVMLDYCRHYTDMRYCLYTARQICHQEGKGLSYTVDQIEDPAKYICMESFHGFINTKQCIDPNVPAYCSSKYELYRAYDQAVMLTTQDNRYDDKKKICSLIQNYLSCQKSMLQVNCTGAASLMDSVQRAWLSPLADRIGCNLKGTMSAAEIAAIALGCLFALALIFSICGNFAARRPPKKY